MSNVVSLKRAINNREVKSNNKESGYMICVKISKLDQLLLEVELLDKANPIIMKVSDYMKAKDMMHFAHVQGQ